MVKFLLVMYFSAEENDDESLNDREFMAIVDSYIEKKVEMSVIPRIGELINLGEGATCLVKNVVHNIPKSLSEVISDVRLLIGVISYAANREGWNLDELSSEGKEFFLKRVKQYEEGKANEREADGVTQQ